MRGYLTYKRWENPTMSEPKSSVISTNNGDVTSAPLSDADLYFYKRRALKTGWWAVIGSIESPLCRHCRTTLRRHVEDTLGEMLDALPEHLTCAAINIAVMETVGSEHHRIEGRWRAAEVRRRFDPPEGELFIHIGGYGQDHCTRTTPCYMNVEVSK